ncbi:MAG: ABC transporter permease [Oscillospiraceae bacterium]|jgi:oligopeptide transport system permease protein|nr:ABC transporter permease [Oscillospiraceae bacterium]
MAMVRYILKRCFIGVATLFVLITVTFFLTRLMPGNPFEGDNVSTATLEKFAEEYGLNLPIHQQYVRYVGKLLQGDLGTSFKKPGVSIVSLIAKGAPATMSLGLTAYVSAMFLGIVIGVWEAVSKREMVRSVLMSLSTLGISVPNFIFAILMMLVFGVWLKWFPTLGLDTPKHYVMPVVTLAVYPVAQISRLVHASFTEAMRMDYVTMAKAKGLRQSTVLFKHILKNALIPVVTNSGPLIAFLMTGSFVVESIFTIPGIGREFVNSVSNRDYTVIMGLTIFVGALIILCNLVCDVICPLVDPRIKITR